MRENLRKKIYKKEGMNEWRNVKQFIFKNIYILTATKQIKSGKIEQENKKKNKQEQHFRGK